MTNEHYDRLKVLKLEYPDLTFNNNGYEYLSPEMREKYSEQIEEISNILKLFIPKFKIFNNFKDRHNGSFYIRCQYRWSESFTGVGYFDIEEFKNQEGLFNLL